MANKIPPIYWDSCVFIDGHQKTAGRIEHIDRYVARARSNDVRIVTSCMAVAEVAKIDKANPLSEEHRRQIAQFFDNDFVSIVPVDRPVSKMAAELVRKFGLKPPDAIHVASALRTQCLRMYTYDDKSGLLALDKSIDGLRIVIPSQTDWNNEMML